MKKTVTLLWLATAGLAWAQATDPHAGHHAAAPAAAQVSPSNAEYEAANAKMHKDMAIPLTGDADRDFLAGMIPHHQGAIDMARVVLKHGKDTKVRQLAEQVIAAQEKELGMMREWLAQPR
ncbi:MAG: DUF305 domain-containing protein [Caulobacter sp.]|nr:DUF305 domain-containing protein [Caulobacter sp.]